MVDSAESVYYSMVRCACEAIANTIRELGHEAHVRIWTDAASARGLVLRSGSGAIRRVKTKCFGLQQKEKNQELRIEKIRGTVNPADLMTKHLDGKRLVMLCDLLNSKRIGGRPSSAPKLTMDTEYISRASRASAAMTLARQAGANEIGVPSGAEHETWIDEHRTDYRTMSGRITVVIMTLCSLMGLVLLWWTSGRVAETLDNGTRTLEEGRCSQDVLTRIMVTKHGKAAHFRYGCPFLVKSHVIQSLGWCSHCDPHDAFEERAWMRRVVL